MTVAAALVAGCTPGRAVPSIPRVTVAPDQQDLVGRWRDAQGVEVPDGRDASDAGVLVLSAISVSTTCSTASVTVLVEVAWPPGRRVDREARSDAAATHRFLRDTKGALLETDSQSDLKAALPPNARSTGLNKDGNTLYAIPSNAKNIWIQRADQRFERWGRLKSGVGCA
jgi:hypothetical protein